MVRVEDRTSQPDPAAPPSSAARLIQIVQTDRSSAARSTSEATERVASIQVSGDDEAAEQSRNYLQTLD
ncbi:hypothetical protein, partial [Bradyrhizobium sp.]